MAVGPEEYRAAARRFASGVTIVTVARNGDLHGMTASSFASVSLVPPLVLVSLEKDSRTRAMVLEVGGFAVNILSEGQRAIAKAFALSGDKPFDDLPHHLDTTGTPFLDGSIASLGCKTVNVVEGGDHDVFLAEVLTTELNEGRPLLYYERDYRSLS